MSTLPFEVAYCAIDTDSTGFVFSSWLQSHRQGDPRTRAVPWQRYKPTQRAVINRTLAAGTVVVAVDPETLSDARRTIYGWACASDDEGVGVLHYVYVIQSRRGVGLGRSLVSLVEAAAGRPVSQYSHSTVVGGRFASRLGLQANPFATLRLVLPGEPSCV